MTYKTFYVSGEHNLICDICGCKVKSGEAQKTWDNLIVCPQDYAEKHPQLLPRPKFRDGRSVGTFVRPEATDTFENIDNNTWGEVNLTWAEVCALWSEAQDGGLPLYGTHNIASRGNVTNPNDTSGGGDL